MRPDGTRAREKSAVALASPYIMPRRYDAQVFVTEYADMDVMRKYIQAKRKEGVHIPYMTLLLSAYFHAYQENPKINRFVMNKRIYDRNHFCVSFTILKTDTDGDMDETCVKVYFEDGDDIFAINRKMEEAVAENKKAANSNAMDKFANFMLSVPLLPTLVVGFARLLDRYGMLPRKIIDLSPFHTSMFITNLASINTSAIFHHCYDFGTTGVFVSMGKPVPDYVNGNYSKKVMPLSCVLDERICDGYDYARFWASFQRYLKHPELMEGKSAKEA